MYFRYKSLKNNKITLGKVEASTEADAAMILKRADFLPIKIWSQDSILSVPNVPFLNRIAFNDIVNFTRQLAIMMNAGLTVIDSITILKKQNSKANLGKVLDEIEKTIREGRPLSTALAKYPQYFSNLYIALVKAGEVSGKLNEVLQRLADNLDKQREFRNKLKTTLAYPIIIIIGVVIVLFIMVTFVMPQLLELYASFDIELPLQTKILIFVSTFSVRFWPLIVIGVGGGIFALRAYMKTPAGKYNVDKMELNLPAFGNFIQMGVLVDSTRTLSILISAGVSILESLGIIVEITGNAVYRKAFQNMYKSIERGFSLGQAFKNEDIFPPLLVQMASVGEQTGHLDESLMRVSKYFESESETATKALSTFIEPAILVILGVCVGFLVYSIITPIYNLTASIK